MSDRWFGFIGGVLATVLGFICSMAWDSYKDARDSGQKERAVLAAVKADLATNIETTAQISGLLQRELEILSQQGTVVLPLGRINSEFWALLRMNIPSNLAKEPTTLVKLQKLVSLGIYINDTITSRESWRVNNQSMSNFEKRLQIYDTELKQLVENYSSSANEIISSPIFKDVG